MWSLLQLCHCPMKAVMDTCKQMGAAVLQTNFTYKNRWQVDLACGPLFADPWLKSLCH